MLNTYEKELDLEEIHSSILDLEHSMNNYEELEVMVTDLEEIVDTMDIDNLNEIQLGRVIYDIESISDTLNVKTNIDSEGVVDLLVKAKDKVVNFIKAIGKGLMDLLAKIMRFFSGSKKEKKLDKITKMAKEPTPEKKKEMAEDVADGVLALSFLLEAGVSSAGKSMEAVQKEINDQNDNYKEQADISKKVYEYAITRTKLSSFKKVKKETYRVTGIAGNTISGMILGNDDMYTGPMDIVVDKKSFMGRTKLSGKLEKMSLSEIKEYLALTMDAVDELGTENDKFNVWLKDSIKALENSTSNAAKEPNLKKGDFPEEVFKEAKSTANIANKIGKSNIKAMAEKSKCFDHTAKCIINSQGEVIDENGVNWSKIKFEGLKV